ncbi:peptidoglycan DD-metalloendopeptidase family protein [Arsenophonus symbiont of Ornithomya chloropus]|uniref:peptidoglycan DD-metalloendopeptidase family protein n=1 Tax=Arsenophonus symbiont of Ornithomya chloropus TaxID=634121 RepID=UPI0032B2724B
MNFDSPKYVIEWAIIYIITSLFLIGCSTKPYQSFTPISSIYDTENKTNTFSSKKVLLDSKNILSYSKNLLLRNDKQIINDSMYEKILNSTSDSKNNNFIKYERNYSNIQKGSYKKNTYVVKKGDTLFYIAWITGNNYYDLARRNQVIPPYQLTIGQILTIDNNSISPREIIINPRLKKNNRDEKKRLSTISNNLNVSRNSKISISSSISNDNKNVFNTIGKWYWPTEGRIIQYFSGMPGGNKGIDIVGLLGQPIFAAAAGKVVYVGNALRGYGNLIIIKHNDDYLSAYAHNDTILVDDQYEVKQGEKIATMGSTGANSVRLHFEIRYKGKSVNPLHYLSKK